MRGCSRLAQLIQKMSCAPAAILKVPGGSLEPGGVADVTVIDLNRKWTVDAGAFKSKSRNCPFNGWELKGKAVMTIVGGENGRFKSTGRYKQFVELARNEYDYIGFKSSSTNKYSQYRLPVAANYYESIECSDERSNILNYP